MLLYSAAQSLSLYITFRPSYGNAVVTLMGLPPSSPQFTDVVSPPCQQRSCPDGTIHNYSGEYSVARGAPVGCIIHNVVTASDVIQV